MVSIIIIMLLVLYVYAFGPDVPGPDGELIKFLRAGEDYNVVFQQYAP